MGILSKLQGENRTPVRVGLTMLAANLSVMCGFVLSIGAIVLLGQVAVDIPPWIAIVAFGIVAVCLWFFLGMYFPQSFSLAATIKSTMIGVSGFRASSNNSVRAALPRSSSCIGGAA